MKRIQDLLGDLSGLDSLTRFAMEIDVSPVRQHQLIQARQALAAAHTKYTTSLKAIEQKNSEGRTLAELEDIIKNAIRGAETSSTSINKRKNKSHADAVRTARIAAMERYRDIRYTFRELGISADPVCVGAWFGIYEGLRDGFAAAYTVLQLCMDEICEALGRKRFPIFDDRYRPYYMELQFETTTGDQNAPITEKMLTQLMVYAAYNDVGLDNKLSDDERFPGFTLRDIFDVGAKTLCFGYLLDNHRPEFGSLWREEAYKLDVMMSLGRPRLLSTFYDETFVERRLRIVVTQLGSYSCPFQIMDRDDWLGGVLSGKIEMHPFKFEYMPKSSRPAIQGILGLPGNGKSTLMGTFDTLTVIERKTWVLMPLPDNSNWATYAFMPQMPIPGNKAYRFNEKKLRIPPQAVPVLILNIVRDESELRDEVLTRYDRIVKVKDHWSFRVDVEKILDELGRIAAEFGYSKPAGIITARHLGRRGTSSVTTKRYDIEVRNAVNLLDSFYDWRRNHQKDPCRVSLDEIKEAGGDTPKSREQSQMSDLIESSVNTARRYQFAMDFIGHVTKDIPQRAREFTVNMFWRSLPEEKSDSKNSLSLLLDSYPIPEDEKLAVRSISRSEAFEKSRLFWWYSQVSKKINLIQPNPPPFQPQIVGKDPIEIYKFYLKMNPKVEDSWFFKDKSNLKADWVATSGDSRAPAAAIMEIDDEDTEAEEGPF